MARIDRRASRLERIGRWLGSLATSAAWLLGSVGAATATDFEAMIITADIPSELAGTRIDDHRPAYDAINGIHVIPIDLGPLPSDVQIDAHDRIVFGVELFSVEQPSVFPGGLEVDPEDVIRWNGSQYSIEFDGAAQGVPKGVNVDAVVSPSGSFSLLLSFDTTVSIGGIVASDEDLVAWDGAGGFSLFFDASSQGIDPALDLDGADYLDQDDILVMSFDGSGQVSFVPFDDEDVIEFNLIDVAWDYAYEPGFIHGLSARRMDTQSVSVVPEPPEIALLMSGVGLLGGLARRRVALAGR